MIVLNKKERFLNKNKNSTNSQEHKYQFTVVQSHGIHFVSWKGNEKTRKAGLP